MQLQMDKTQRNLNSILEVINAACYVDASRLDLAYLNNTRRMQKRCYDYGGELARDLMRKLEESYGDIITVRDCLTNMEEHMELRAMHLYLLMLYATVATEIPNILMQVSTSEVLLQFLLANFMETFKGLVGKYELLDEDTSIE